MRVFKDAPYHNIWDRMYEYEPHEPDVTLEQLQAIQKNLYGTLLGMQVWGVDGLYIRGTKDIDFTSGGNPARYRYVPNNELWVESSLSPPDALAVSVHEGIETVLMLKGIAYDNAHDLSNVFEWNLRQEMLQGGLQSPATHADAIAMADGWLREKVKMIRKSLMQRRMSFPSTEVPALRQQLKSFGFAFTTRVDSEQGKWKVGDEAHSPLGRVKIVAVETVGSLSEHPFLNELTPGQKTLLSKYDRLDIVKFVPVK